VLGNLAYSSLRFASSRDPGLVRVDVVDTAEKLGPLLVNLFRHDRDQGKQHPRLAPKLSDSAVPLGKKALSPPRRREQPQASHPQAHTISRSRAIRTRMRGHSVACLAVVQATAL
jgi:hypothetical protein